MNFYDHSRTLLADFPYGPRNSPMRGKAAIVSLGD